MSTSGTGDKIKKLRVWITDKGKVPDKKVTFEKNITSSDLSKPFEFDVHADFISDAAAKKKVADLVFSYDGTIPTPDPTTNTKPIARAGNDQTVKPQTTVTLDGSNSSDPDTNDKIVKYDWTQIAGKNVKLVYDNTLAIAKFIAPELGNTPPPPPPTDKCLDGECKDPLTKQCRPISANEIADPITGECKFKPIDPPPPEPGGSLLYDSNIHGKWNNGVKRTVKGTEGDQKPNGKGLHTAASGSPRLIIDGDGVAHLEADAGHGRIYVKATNYNARLEFDFMFEDTNIDNISFKLRSRHNMGGDCSNRFGGFGGAIDRAGGGLDFKTESCHNNHENSINGKVPSPITQGKWYRAGISVYDNPDKKQVNLKFEIDYKDGQGWKTALTGSHKNPQAFYVDEPKFMEESYFWLRINNEKTGKVAFKDVKLTKIDIAKPFMTAEELLSDQQTVSGDEAGTLVGGEPSPAAVTATASMETLSFRLKVTDTKGLSATDDVNVYVTGDPDVPPPPPPPPTGDTIKIIGFGDTDTTPDATKIQTQILKEPNTSLVIGLGDYPYSGRSTAWCEMMDKAGWTPERKAKLVLIQGNHEDEESETEQSQIDIEQWVNKHNAANPQYPMPKLDVAYEQGGDNTWEKPTWLSSQHINNVYMINMNTQDLDVEFERNQFKWVTKQIDFIKRLKAEGKIDWVIATSHKPWFTLKTSHSPYTAVRNVYNDLFRNVVDFNLHGHNHNTQLWKPMIVDKTQGGNGVGIPLYSMLPDGKTFDFSKEHGWLTIVSGHAGHEHNKINESGNQNVLWYNDTVYGYTVLEITGKQAKVFAKDITGKVLYEYTVQK